MRTNSWQKLHHGICLFLSSVDKNRVCSTTEDGLSSLTLQQGTIIYNFLMLYAYDVADVIDNHNYATVVESFVSTSLLQAAQDYTKKVSGLDHLVLSKKWGISPEKILNMIHSTTHNMVFTQCCIYPCLGGLGQMIICYGIEDYCTTYTVIHCCHNIV